MKQHVLKTRLSKTVFHLYNSIFTIDLLTQKIPFVVEFINKHCSLFNIFFSSATGGRKSYIHFADFYSFWKFQGD